MPQIIPIKDLKNTSEISDMCHKTEEPIYVTKNGYGDMVIMSMEIYESTMRQIAMYRDIEISEKQIEAGQVKNVNKESQMPKRIIFQFEDDLDYQIQAIHSTVELFRGLSRHVDGIYRPSRTRKFGEGDPVRNNDIVVGSRLLENLRKVQLANGLFADNVLAEGNNGLT